MNRQLRLLVVLAVAAPGLAGAQSGLTFDFRLEENVAGQIQSSVGHGMIAGNNVRMDIVGPNSLSQFNQISLGDSMSVISVDTGTKQVLSLIGHAEKQYIQFAPILMMQKMRDAMGAMPGVSDMDFAGSKVTLDSIGPGGVIGGYNTLHYRLSITMKVAVSGQPMGDQSVVNDFYIAPELKEFARANGVLDGSSEMTGSMPGIPKSFTDDLVAAQKRIEFGMAVRTETVATASMFGTEMSRRQAIEASNIKRVDIPPSSFVVPAGYKKIVPAGMDSLM